MPTPMPISFRLPRLSFRSAFRLAAGMAALCAAAAVSPPAQAQGEWPTQPVTILMGFTAGSGVDMVGRALQESLQKSLKTTIIYDYRPGAGGNVASEVVAHAKPDGCAARRRDAYFAAVASRRTATARLSLPTAPMSAFDRSA